MERKKTYVKALVDIKSVARRKGELGNKSRRQNSLYFYLKAPNQTEKIRVCKKQFLNTLSIGEWSVLRWLKHNLLEDEEEKFGEEKMENRTRTIF